MMLVQMLLILVLNILNQNYLMLVQDSGMEQDNIKIIPSMLVRIQMQKLKKKNKKTGGQMKHLFVTPLVKRNSLMNNIQILLLTLVKTDLFVIRC